MFYNWNIIGHEKELTHLEEDLAKDKIHHAYLFVGPEKIGKFRVAKTMAGILQCEKNFCHSCPTCVQVEKKCHPDTMEFDDDGESIKIDTIRDIIARLSMTSQNPYKILMIQNIGRLTEEAANCLLKTLEEPLGKTVFLFTASQLRDIKPTVASRMRIVHFKKLDEAILRTALRKRHPEISDEMLERAVELSLGRSGRAIQLLDEPESYQEVLEMYQQIQFLEEKASGSTRFLSFQELAQKPDQMVPFLTLLTHYFRKKMHRALRFAESKQAIRMICMVHETLDLLSRNVNPRLLLERLALAL